VDSFSLLRTRNASVVPNASTVMIITEFSKKSVVLVYPRRCQWMWGVNFLDVLNVGESEKMTRSISCYGKCMEYENFIK